MSLSFVNFRRDNFIPDFEKPQGKIRKRSLASAKGLPLRVRSRRKLFGPLFEPPEPGGRPFVERLDRSPKWTSGLTPFFGIGNARIRRPPPERNSIAAPGKFDIVSAETQNQGPEKR